MPLNINREVARMKAMPISDLKQRFEDVCGRQPRSSNRDWLIKKIAWRLQADIEGDLPERVRLRALALADDSDLRIRPTRQFAEQVDEADRQTSLPTWREDRDPRLPPPGEPITKVYKGQTLTVLVREEDFEFNGETYKSLTAIANEVTGSHVNGYAFFNLGKAKEQSNDTAE